MEKATRLGDNRSGCPGFFVNFSKDVKCTERFFDGKGSLDEFCIAIRERGRICLKELFDGRGDRSDGQVDIWFGQLAVGRVIVKMIIIDSALLERENVGFSFEKHRA
jgi:hypothetical protein